MKIQCSVCEVAEANILCCADEAALCWACDQNIHAANKLATMHQRVPLSSSSSQMPKCDICQADFSGVSRVFNHTHQDGSPVLFPSTTSPRAKSSFSFVLHQHSSCLDNLFDNKETVGYFFCIEDRALLCRKCDFSIHSANSLVSAHQRYLLTGVKVGLYPMEPGSSTSPGKSHTNEKVTEPEPNSLAKRSTQLSSNGQRNICLPAQVREGGNFASPRLSFEGSTTPGNMSMWQIDDFLGLSDFNQSYNFLVGGSSKAVSGKLGDSNCSPFLQTADEDLEGDMCLSQVPDTFRAVLQIPFPPTASGLYWPKNNQKRSDAAVSVPDIVSSSLQNFHR